MRRDGKVALSTLISIEDSNDQFLLFWIPLSLLILHVRCNLWELQSKWKYLLPFS